MAIQSYRDLMAWQEAMRLVKQTYVLIGEDLGYHSKEETEHLLAQTARVGRIVNALSASLPAQRASVKSSLTDHRPPTTDHCEELP